MAGRNNLSASSRRYLIGEHHVTHLEDRITIQHREIQSLLLDNQRLAANHVALKQDLSLAQQELRHLTAAANNVKAERDAEVREVYERSLKMNAEVRAINALRAELAKVHCDIEKLTLNRQELTEQLQVFNSKLGKAKEEVKKFPEVKSAIEMVQQEVEKGRAAIETEKKTRASNLKQRQILEKNMILVSQELERLRKELGNVDEREMVTTAAGVAANPASGYCVDYGHPGTFGGPKAQDAGAQSDATSSDMKIDDQGSQAHQ